MSHSRPTTPVKDTSASRPAHSVHDVVTEDHSLNDTEDVRFAGHILDSGGCRCSPSTEGSRNLVVCIDGTSNQFGINNTNVIELYRLVKKLPEDKQLTYYNSGIGTYAKPSWKSWHYMRQVLDHKVDLLIAWNFERIVLNAYRWLSDNYEEGDRIFLFGFSRGAYQVRALSAMIDKVGLIHKGNEEQIPFAYELYAADESENADGKAKKGDEKSGKGDGGPNWTKAMGGEGGKPGKGSKKVSAKRFKETFSRQAGVHFVGVWDTVSSVGIVRHKVLPGTADGMKHVCFFRHALALDERRVKFLPEYVNQGMSSEEANTSQTRSLYAKEVWFMGTHSDIGGGNVNNETLDRRPPPLRWMVYQAVAAGLRLDTLRTENEERHPEMHESLSGIWWTLEVLPIKRLSYKTKDGTKRWWPHFGAARRIKDGQMIHKTALDFFQVSESYTPKAKPSWDWNDTSELSKHLEQDAYEAILSDLEKCEKRIKEVGNEGHAAEQTVLSSLTRWLEFEGGRRALRDRDAVKELLSKAKPVAHRLTADHINELVTFSICIGPGSAEVFLREISGPLETKLREHSRWSKFRETVFPNRAFSKLSGQSGRVYSVAASRDGERIVSGSEDKTVRLWNAKTGEAVGDPFFGHGEGVLCVAFSPDGEHIISGSADKTIRIWDTAGAGTILQPIIGHTGNVNSVAVSSVGGRIVSGSDDTTIRLWDAGTGRAVMEPLMGHRSVVWSVAFSLDGERIVSGSKDEAVRVWDAASGRALREFKGHSGQVWSVGFSPDGTRIVSGSRDRTIRIWDTATGVPSLAPIKGHTGDVNSVSFSPDGRRIASGSDDKTICVWDVKTGDAVGEPLKGHRYLVWSVVFSADGKQIISGSTDETVRIYDVVDLVV